MRTLVVAALAEEVAHVRDAEVLVTGIGKAVAAVALARRLTAAPAPDVVVNLGTAGAVGADHDPGDRAGDAGTRTSGLVEVGFVTQHDFPYAGIEALVGPMNRGFALSHDEPPVPVRERPAGVRAVATGDVFVSDPDHARAVASTGVHLVDMEAFAYAAACAEFRVPMICVKAVSDAADGDAGASWLDSIDACARALAEWLHCHIQGT